MIGTLRALAGDALIAAGELVRGAPVRFPGITPADYDPTVKVHEYGYGWHAPFKHHTDEGAMEADGPMLSWPAPPIVTEAEVRAALDDLDDSTLFGICATIIEGWKPILFTSHAGREASVDVDTLVTVLRDRRDQFRAVERDASEPFLTPHHLDAHIAHASEVFPQHRRGQ